MTLAERLLGTSLPPHLLPETLLDLEAWSQQQLERLAALGQPPEALPPAPSAFLRRPLRAKDSWLQRLFQEVHPHKLVAYLIKPSTPVLKAVLCA